MEFERRTTGLELRAEGRRLTGTVMRYGDVSASHRERFEPGSLRIADSVHLDLDHDPERAVAWHPGGGLTLANGRAELKMTAVLPPIPAANRALDEIRAGRVGGLSVEFRAVKERRDGNLRVIENAELRGIGLVRNPSYQQSHVEARRRSGRTMRATIPAGRSLECRCSGAECKFARFVKEGMEQAFNSAFRQFEREVIAGFGSYDMPLASASSGTLRGRILGNGDGEVEIDLPGSIALALSTLASRMPPASAVIVTPKVDLNAEPCRRSRPCRFVSIREAVPIREFSVVTSAAYTDRDGWPAPVLVLTPEELASASAPRLRRRRRGGCNYHRCRNWSKPSASTRPRRPAYSPWRLRIGERDSRRTRRMLSPTRGLSARPDGWPNSRAPRSPARPRAISERATRRRCNPRCDTRARCRC